MTRALAIAALLACAGCEAEPAAGLLRGTPGEGALWVLSYNVNFERPSQATVDAIGEIDADVVFLQETTGPWEELLRAGLADRYETILVHDAEREGGMTILSRHPIEERAVSESPLGAFPAWCVTIDTPLGALDALAVHLHPPLDEEGSLIVGFFTTDEKRSQELTHHLECFEDAPDLVVGDFNEGSGGALEQLASLGMLDAQEAHPPLEKTWSWEHWATELQGRPDHVLAGGELRVSAVQVVQAGASDHRPLRAAIQRAEAPR
jgi:endonuclease/exonuclease/phosphatase (EEP) superfamily protein YafD